MELKNKVAYNENNQVKYEHFKIIVLIPYSQKPQTTNNKMLLNESVSVRFFTLTCSSQFSLV